MAMLDALLRWLPRFFERDPLPYMALRIGFSGPAPAGYPSDGAFGLRWSVGDRTLTLTPSVGGVDVPATTYPLANHTLASLANAISADGFEVLLEVGPDRSALSALVLLDGSGDVGTSNGNALFAWSNLLFAYLVPLATELEAAKQQIDNLPLQMDTNTAEEEWLDFLSSYYDVKRKVGELDRDYGARIIAEVLRPLSNNNAIANAIIEATGQPTRIVDVTIYGNVIPAHDGTHDHDSEILHSSSTKPIYGLFDAVTSFNLLSTQMPDQYQAAVRDLVSRMRAAGTHLRAVELSGSVIDDDGPKPTNDVLSAFSVSTPLTDTTPGGDDGGASISLTVRLQGTLADSAAAGADTSALILSYSQTTTFNGFRDFDGGIPFGSAAISSETL